MNATYFGMFLKANLGTVKRDNQNNVVWYATSPGFARKYNVGNSYNQINVVLLYSSFPGLHIIN